MSTTDLLTILGLFAALLTILGGGFAFVWSEKKELEQRLKAVEDDHVFLKPLADRLKRKLEEASIHIAESKGP